MESITVVYTEKLPNGMILQVDGIFYKGVRTPETSPIIKEEPRPQALKKAN